MRELRVEEHGAFHVKRWALWGSSERGAVPRETSFLEESGRFVGKGGVSRGTLPVSRQGMNSKRKLRYTKSNSDVTP